MKTLLKSIFSLIGIAASLFLIWEFLQGDKESGDLKKRLKTESTPKKLIDSTVKEHEILLNDRQKKILKMFKSREVLYPSDIYAILPNVSTRTIRRDMTSLSDLNIVIQKGNTRDAHYLLSSK